MRLSRAAFIKMAGIVLLASVAGPAGAAVTYDYVATPASQNVNTSATVAVTIYLRETLTSGSTSLLNTEKGLFGFGVRVTRSSGTATITSMTADSGFNGGVTTTPIATSTDYEISSNVAVSNTTGPGNGVSGTVNLVPLATVNLQTAAAQNETTTFTVARYSNPPTFTGTGGNTLTFTNGYDIDANSSSPAFTGATGNQTFSVTTVPEPSTLGLATVAVGLAALRRRRATR